ncbi:MAG: radical SAM protein, partial [bacterium]
MTIIPLFIPHLGCPHQCVFCDQRRISGAAKPVTPAKVREEIEKALALLPAELEKTVAFYGGSFTCLPLEEQEALLAVAKGYLDRGLIHALRLSTRPDGIDPETLARLS